MSSNFLGGPSLPSYWIANPPTVKHLEFLEILKISKKSPFAPPLPHVNTQQFPLTYFGFILCTFCTLELALEYNIRQADFLSPPPSLISSAQTTILLLSNTLHCSKTNKNELGISQWRLLTHYFNFFCYTMETTYPLL